MIDICAVDDIPEAEPNHGLLTGSNQNDSNAYEAKVEIEGVETAIFLIKHDGNVKAYVNSCPHTGVKLNWQEGQFLDTENAYIQCSVHGALFEKTSGRCVHGPCVNQSLQSLAVQLKNDRVYLSD